ncbi:MAG TPA: uroporphyrinogen decarboxylase [Acetobacteraceae bacterium]|nr:uroporphyrinogen decarboxylase [Acetobacteraceae bacterium]
MLTGSKPLLQALQGNPVWPPPIWLMRQAGRYLSEYRAVRAQAGDFITLCMSPVLAAEVTMQPVRRFGFDAAILFSDILMLPRGLGQCLAFKDGEGPVLPPLEPAGLAALDLRRLPEAIEPILETVRRVSALLAKERPDTTLLGFAGAPFTVACYMVEGGGSKDFVATRSLIYRDPELFQRLVDLLVEATVTYLAAQVDAGAEAVMLFDSWAGILPPRLFRDHVIAPTRRIVNALRARNPTLPVIGFPRLAGPMLAEYAARVGADAVGFDTPAEPTLAARQVPDHVALQGNLDPLALVAGGAAMRQDTRSILEAMRGRPFVFNLGHGVVPQTPPEHVAELVELVRAG